MLYYIVNSLGSAGIVVGMEPILFDTVPEEYRASALSLKNVLAGVLSFLATLASTPLMNYIQASGNTFLGIRMYAQQLFGVISFALMLISMLLFRSYVKKNNAKDTAK